MSTTALPDFQEEDLPSAVHTHYFSVETFLADIERLEESYPKCTCPVAQKMYGVCCPDMRAYVAACAIRTAWIEYFDEHHQVTARYREEDVRAWGVCVMKGSAVWRERLRSLTRKKDLQKKERRA